MKTTLKNKSNVALPTDSGNISPMCKQHNVVFFNN